jgi:hypothetical protein
VSRVTNSSLMTITVSSSLPLSFRCAPLRPSYAGIRETNTSADWKREMDCGADEISGGGLEPAAW